MLAAAGASGCINYFYVPPTPSCYEPVDPCINCGYKDNCKKTKQPATSSITC